MYFKIRSSESLKLFKRQRNVCSRLYKREKKKYFINLELNKITKHQLLWKTTKPVLSDNGVNTTKISLISVGKTVTEDKEGVNILNQYNGTTVNCLDIIKVNLFLQKLKI